MWSCKKWDDLGEREIVRPHICCFNCRPGCGTGPLLPGGQPGLALPLLCGWELKPHYALSRRKSDAQPCGCARHPLLLGRAVCKASTLLVEQPILSNHVWHTIFFRLASLKALPRGLPQGYLCCRGSLWRCRWCYQPFLTNSESLQSPGRLEPAGSALHLQPMASAEQSIVSSAVLCPLPSVLEDKVLQVGETKKMWLFCFRMNPLMWRARGPKRKQSPNASCVWPDLTSNHSSLHVSISSDLHGLIEGVFSCLSLPVFWPWATGLPENLSSWFLSPSSICCVGVGFFPTLPVLTVLLIYPIGHH